MRWAKTRANKLKMLMVVLPCIIQSTSERIKTNSEMILPLTHRARHLVIALRRPTSIAKIIGHSGSDLYNLESKNPHLVPRIPVPDLQTHSNPAYRAIPGTGILAYFQQDLLDVQSILLLAARKTDTALLLNLMRKRLQQCCARTMMWPTVQCDQIIL